MQTTKLNRVLNCAARAMLICFAIAITGCTPQRAYQVTIVNETPTAITVGICKDTPPYERDLAPVEHWAIESPLDSLPQWGFAIPAGKTGDSPVMKGKFPAGTQAYLRVFRGEPNNAEMMAVSPPSPHRMDILLFPNVHNEIIVKDNKGHFEYVRVAPRPK